MRIVIIHSQIIDKEAIKFFCDRYGVTNVLLANDRIANDKKMCVSATAIISPIASVAVKEIRGAISLLCKSAYKQMKMLILLESCEDALKVLEQVDGVDSVCILTTQGEHTHQNAERLSPEKQVILKQIVSRCPNAELWLSSDAPPTQLHDTIKSWHIST